jgi:hypothetical protein
MAIDVTYWGRGHGFEKDKGTWECLSCGATWTLGSDDRSLVNKRGDGSWDMPCPSCHVSTRFIADADKPAPEPAEDAEYIDPEAMDDDALAGLTLNPNGTVVTGAPAPDPVAEHTRQAVMEQMAADAVAAPKPKKPKPGDVTESVTPLCDTANAA